MLILDEIREAPEWLYLEAGGMQRSKKIGMAWDAVAITNRVKAAMNISGPMLK
jgi:hypothetical protein